MNQMSKVARRIYTRRSALASATALLTNAVFANDDIAAKKHRRKRKKKVTLCFDYQTITVGKKQQDNYLREGATQGACTCLNPSQNLQAAIDAAASGTTIELCPGTWQFPGFPNAFNAAMTLTKDLRIVGSGSERTILSGWNANIHGMIVGRQAVVHVEGLTFTEFRPAYQSGAGITNDGALTLVDVVISGCGLPDNNNTGGGINNNGNMSLVKCTVTGNMAESTGGIVNIGTATLSNCRVTNNSNGGPGGSLCGGISNGGTINLIETLVAENKATNGESGGIFNSGMLTLDRSQVTRNAVAPRQGEPGDSVAGGIFNRTSGTVVLKPGSTVTDNTPNNCAGSESPVSGCID